MLRQAGQISIEGEDIFPLHDALGQVGDKRGSATKGTLPQMSSLLYCLQHVPLIVNPGDFFTVGVNDVAGKPGVVGITGAVSRVAEGSRRLLASLHHGKLSSGQPAHGIAVTGEVGVVMLDIRPHQFRVEYPDAQGLCRGEHGGFCLEDVELAGPDVDAGSADHPAALLAPFAEQAGHHDMLPEFHAQSFEFIIHDRLDIGPLNAKAVLAVVVVIGE
ncbi:hypothetical protein ES703_52756 [subsurface metagenome]